MLDDDIFGQSAALAFYGVVTMAPLIMLLLIFLASLGLDLQNEMLYEVNKMMGSSAATVLQTIVKSAKDRPDLISLSGLLGTIFLIVSVSVMFAQLQSTLNQIFEPLPGARQLTIYEKFKSFMMRRLISLLMVVSFIAITIVALISSTALAYFISQGEDPLVLRAASLFANIFIFTILFTLIYKILPERKLNFKSSLICGACTSLFFIFGKALIGLYLSQAAVGSAHGAAGAIVVLLLWLYYSAFVVFMGAEISSLFLIPRLNKKASA